MHAWLQAQLEAQGLAGPLGRRVRIRRAAPRTAPRCARSAFRAKNRNRPSH